MFQNMSCCSLTLMILFLARTGKVGMKRMHNAFAYTQWYNYPMFFWEKGTNEILTLSEFSSNLIFSNCLNQSLRGGEKTLLKSD